MTLLTFPMKRTKDSFVTSPLVKIADAVFISTANNRRVVRNFFGTMEVTTDWDDEKKEKIVLSLDDLALCVPVFGCEQEFGAHVQGRFWTYIIALGAEDALGDIDPDPFCLRDELNGMGRADPQAEGAPDACFPVVDDLSTEFRGCRHRGMDRCLSAPDLCQEPCHGGGQVPCRERVGGRCAEELLQQFRDEGESGHVRSPR